MQHAILQVMKCMMLSKESVIKANDSAGKSQLSLKHHAQPISRWKSSVRNFWVRRPSQLDGLQIMQNAAPVACSNLLLTLKSSDGKCLQARICQYIYKSAFTKAHLAYSSHLCSLTQLLKIHRAISNSKSRFKTLRKAYPKAQTVRNNCRPEIREDDKQDEPSATNLASNNGGNRRQSTGERFLFLTSMRSKYWYKDLEGAIGHRGIPSPTGSVTSTKTIPQHSVGIWIRRWNALFKIVLTSELYWLEVDHHDLKRYLGGGWKPDRKTSSWGRTSQGQGQNTLRREPRHLNPEDMFI
ncbi:alpha-L-fucosidase 1 [Dorcoceras hygrometricum]|uniref:Alpha-L-fucosidase 1 n=1 Tax=Dorcoceras hygrometricum TaxID=472368 RepID=A0A2Z7AEE7_9LAMI|nr:alpha-L-fucosidase 1 [Dorcoceras hygrometricum]